jgi:potassium voltage-gated channel Eag-related subfamily H protein 5
MDDMDDDTESTLIREASKHGILLDHKKFQEYSSLAEPRALQPRWVILPSSRFSWAWHLLITFMTIGIATLEPFCIAFDYDMTLQRRVKPIPLIDFIFGFLLLIDTFVINLFLEAKVVTCKSTGRRKLITTPRLFRRLYVYESGQFYTDVLISVPFIVQLISSMRGRSSQYERLSRVLRILRVFRILGSSSLSSPEVLFMKLIPSTPLLWYLVLNLFVSFLLLTHSLACVYIYLAVQNQDESWLSYTGLDINSASETDVYVAALYFASTCVTTVGFGDITPTTTLERVWAVAGMIVGASFFAYLIASLASTIEFFTSVSRTRKYRERINRVHAFLSRIASPNALRRHALSFVAEVEPRHDVLRENEDILNSLPTDLRNDIAVHVLGPVFNRTFGAMSDRLLYRIVSMFDCQVVKPGRIIESGFFYVLTHGVVTLSVLGPDAHVVAVVSGASRASYFGIASLLSPYNPTLEFKATSLTVCEVWRIAGSTLNKLFLDHAHFPNYMLERILSCEDEDFERELRVHRTEILQRFIASIAPTSG